MELNTYDKINTDISDIGKTVEAHAVRMDYIDVLLIGPESRKSMVSNYKERTTKEDTGNPISPEEKQRLIEKFENDTIERDEAEKLKRILEEEKKEAETAGNSLAAIAIGLLLAALAYLLYKLISSEE